MENKEMINNENKENEKTEDLGTPVQDFTRMIDLSQEDIAKLPRVSVILAKRENKKSKRISYSINVRLHDYCKINRTLNEIRFNLIKIRLGLDMKKAEETLRVPVRFVTGTTDKGNDYYQMELILGNGLYESIFLEPFNEFELFQQIFGDKIKFETRPDKIEEQNISYASE